MSKTDPTRETFAAEPWGAPFVRELDLVIAANVVASAAAGQTLYNRDLEARVAARCAPLDAGLVDVCLGVRDWVSMPDERWKEEEATLADLRGAPRGTWAVVRMDGRYDAWMADGRGGYDTEAGNKFTYSGPHAPALSHPALYAAVLSWAIYCRRREIEARIASHSVDVGMPALGTVVQGQYVNGKKWKLEFAGPADEEGRGRRFVLKASRPGVRSVEFLVPDEALKGYFGLPSVMPPEFEDPANEARLRTLSEERCAAAQAAWDALEGDGLVEGVDRRGTKGGFRIDGDAASRIVWRAGEAVEEHSGRFVVDFAPGTADVTGRRLEDDPAVVRSTACAPAR